MRSTIYTQLKSGIRVLTAMLLLGMHFNVSAQKTELPAEARNIPNYPEFWANEPFAKYDPATELLEKRDQVSKHFRNADGTITAHIASGPINYLEDGQWKTIYHTIEPSANGGFQNTYNSFRTHYPATASGEIVTVLPDGTEMHDMQGMRMYYEANGQEIGSMNIANTPGSVNFNKLTYSGVYGSQIDLRLTQNSTERKMDYLLQSASALNGAPQNAQYLVFEEKISLPQGVTAKLVENKIILSNAKGEVIAEYTNPDIYDEQPADTEDENYLHRSEATYQIQQNGNVLTIKTKVEITWLLDVNRNFPVVVDPTVNVIQFSNNNAGKFAYIRNNQNSTSFTGYQSCDALYQGYYSPGTDFAVGRRGNAGNPSRSRFFFAQNTFDISSVPSGSTINSSQLYYNVFAYSGTNNGTISIRKNTANSPVSCGDLFNGMTSTEYFTNSTYNAGWKNGSVTPGDIQNNLAAGWFGIGYWPAGSYSGTNRFWIIDGVYEVTRPYIAVTYTTNPAWQTTWVSMNTGASTWCAGETRDVTVTVTNAATSTWTNSAPDVNIGVKWNGDADYFVRTDANGLVSGATQTYTLTVTAPNAGANNLSFDVVNEGNFWFASNSNGAGPNNAVYTSAQITISAPPTVTTTTASAVDNFTATSGGNVTNDGGSSVTARGVLWGITPGLTMPSASSTSDGAGTGSFTSSITGLSASTIYYYRAYAQNSCYGYGPENIFVTTGPAAEGFYISGNIVNNGEIISTFDENYLRMTGVSKTITGSGKFTNSKLFADGTTTFDAGLNAASAFTETFVNAGKSLTISNARTFKNGTMANYGTLTIATTGNIDNTSDWFNASIGTVTFGGTGTIYAGANWTNDGTFAAGTGTVEFNGSTSGNTINGTTAFYRATINKEGSSTATILDVVGTVTQTNTLTFTNGLLRIPTGGSWTKTGSGPTIGATSGLHVNGGTFTQNGASITNNGLFKTTTGTATIGSSSGNSITNQSGSSFIIDGAGTVNIAGRLGATGSGSFNQSAGTLNVCTSGNSSSTLGSLNMTSGTSFTMTGGAINMVQKSTGATQIDYKNLAGTVSISGGTLTIGTTATSASSNFNIQGVMPPLVVDNTTNAKTATINGASTVYGNVTINSTSSLVLNSGVTATVNGSLSNSGTYNATGTLNLSGDWTNTGTVTANAPSLVTFFGSSDQNVTSGGSSFANVTLNNTGSAGYEGIVLQDAMTVNGALTFTDGNIQLGVNDLTIGASGTVVTPSATSHVITASSGVVTKNTLDATEFTFPVGTSISLYTPIKLANSGTADNFSVYVTDDVLDGGTTGSIYNTGRVAKTWHVSESTVGGSSVTMTPYWSAGDEDAQFDRTVALVSHWDGSAWDMPIEAPAQTSGSLYYVSRSGLSSFSPFMVQRNSFTPLPITLSYFGGTCNPEGNKVMWVTSSEQNSSHFDLKRSYDGIKWEHVGQKQGAGNSATDIEYVIWDVEGSRHEVTYYELRQFDYNNDSAVYGPIAVRCENIDSDINGSLSPNPTAEASYLAIENCPLGEATITLMSSTGQIVYTDRIMVTKKNDVYFIDSLDLTRGSYVVRFQAPNGQIVAMKLVKN